MKRRLKLNRSVKSDLRKGAQWYNQERGGLGAEFLDEVTRAIRDAASSPEHFRLLQKDPEVRRVKVSRFPYLAYFAVTESEVIVFAVLHGARHPKVWKSRLGEN